jgi:transposase
MKCTELYALGVETPWGVREVEMDMEGRRIVVRLEVDLGKVGEGGRYHVHSWEGRRWRHLATMQFETVKVIKSSARGFRNPKNWRISILFHMGKLHLSPYHLHLYSQAV